jgi:hypothetical protein
VSLLVTMPSTFWLHADESTRFGMWLECFTYIPRNSKILSRHKTVIINSQQIAEYNLNNKNDLVCDFTDNGKKKKRKRNENINKI